MKFSLGIKKHGRIAASAIRGHNARTHPTTSQLVEEAWFSKEGAESIVPFNAELLAEAKGLATRADAVVAMEFILQIGNQTDWRETPTDETPWGKPRSEEFTKPRIKALVAAAKKAIYAEFGKERVICMDLHLDESTPHVQVAIAPIREVEHRIRRTKKEIKEGKPSELKTKKGLQAKYWLDGKSQVAALRQRLHSHVNTIFECTYQKYVEGEDREPGGLPYDPTKAAGAINGPKPEPKFFDKFVIGQAENKRLKEEVRVLNQRIDELNRQLQVQFSRSKNHFSEMEKLEKKLAEQSDFRKKAVSRMAEAERKTAAVEQASKATIAELEATRERLQAVTQEAAQWEALAKLPFAERMALLKQQRAEQQAENGPTGTRGLRPGG